MRFAPPSAPLLAALLPFGLVLPFLAKPVHVDDANFLALAQGARLDLWRPHAVPINWQGTLQPAFDVLSNPPGIAWWLAPVVDAPIWVQHLWMLPWLALALWGAAQLGQALARGTGSGGTGSGATGSGGTGSGGRGTRASSGQRSTAALLLIGSSPVVLLAAQSLTPDLPLLACTLAGLGGFARATERQAWGFALLTGCAVLFRYSGLTLLPLLLLLGWQRGRLRQALLGVLPLLLLALHDLHAYGEVHLLAMSSFQSVSNTPREVLRKGIASVAMLGGAGLLPLLSGRRGLPAALFGAALGGVGVWISSLTGIAAVVTVLCAASGAAVLSTMRGQTPSDRWLLAWGIGGLLFLLTLRFSATRYWLPFLAAPVLAALRLSPDRRLLALTVSLQAGLALLLSVDDAKMAQAHAQAAAWVGPGPGSVAGHWGWQHHMEALGWTPLEEGGAPLGRLAVAQSPWPQSVDPAVCLVLERSLEVPDTWPGPRSHGALAGANLHAYVVAGDPPTETYAPWGFSDEPYERVRVLVPCELGPTSRPDPSADRLR